MMINLIMDVRDLLSEARYTLVGLVNATVSPAKVVEYVVTCCHTTHEPIPLQDILGHYDNYDGEDFQHDSTVLYTLVDRLTAMYYRILSTSGKRLDPMGNDYSTYPFVRCEVIGVSLFLYLTPPQDMVPYLRTSYGKDYTRR